MFTLSGGQSKSPFKNTEKRKKRAQRDGLCRFQVILFSERAEKGPRAKGHVGLKSNLHIRSVFTFALLWQMHRQKHCP